MIAARAQLVFHQVAVIGGIFQVIELEQRLHHIADGVFHIIDVVIGAARVGGLPQHCGGGGLQRGHIFLIGDKLVFVHHPQGVIRAGIGDGRVIGGFGGAGVVIAAGIVIVGIGAQPGQHGALAQGQLIQLLAEIAARGGIHAVVVFAQVDGVQVAFQNLLLAVLGFQLHGQVGLLDLALIALLAGQDGVFNQLLGDGAAALLAAADKVFNKRADNALDVNAVVGVKARVLHGHKGVAQAHGHLRYGHHHAVLGALVIRNQVALRVIDKRGLRLIVNQRQIQRRGGIHIRAGNAHHRACARQHEDEHNQRQRADGIDHHGGEKIGPAHAGLENAARFAGISRGGRVIC